MSLLFRQFAEFDNLVHAVNNSWKTIIPIVCVQNISMWLCHTVSLIPFKTNTYPVPIYRRIVMTKLTLPFCNIEC